MKICIVFLMILLPPVCYAQVANWPPDNWKDTSVFYRRSSSATEIPHQRYYGWVVLKNGDTLTGIMEIIASDCRLLKTGSFTVTTIPAKKIKYIRINGNAFKNGYLEIYTLGVKHPKDFFWRLVKRRGGTAIFDLFLGVWLPNTREEFESVMLVLTNNKFIRIYSDFSSFLHGDHENGLVLKFINKHYHQSFKTGYFKTGQDMIDYILDKENENNKP